MTVKKSYDAIIIGGGHMGITLGAYLQRAGMETAVFERRHEEGSAIYTSECTAPGFLHNLHAQYMEFLDWMPFYHDFGLEKLGARTFYPMAQSGIAFSDGRPPIVLYSVEKPEYVELSRKSIAAYSKHDAETFVDIRKKVQSLEEMMVERLYNPPELPTPENPDPDFFAREALLEILGLPPHYGRASPRTVIDCLFETPELRALMYRKSVEWGIPVEMEGMGMAGITSCFWLGENWRLMAGGTHTLAHAMVMAAVREGMDFYESSEVVKILLEGKRAVGVRLKDGTEIQARKLVASNADLKATLLEMVGEKNLSPLWARRARDFRIGPSCVLACTGLALHEAPRFKSARHNPDIDKTFYTVVGFDTPEEMLDYWRSTPGWGTTVLSGMQVDEYGPNFGDEKLINTVRSVAMLAEDPDFAGRQWIPFVGHMYGADAAELFMKTTLAAGWPFSIERYIGELPTEDEDRAQIDSLLVGEAEGWENAYPGSLRHAIFTLMYAYLPYCTTNRCPTVDFHIHLQMQMQALATHPAWFGLWGVQPYRANYVNEEIQNCMSALLRHYCIEGRTDPLLADPCELRHVLNPDFEGTEHWQLAPAGEGSITTDSFAGYGTLQGRYPWADIGETFLVMKRSAERPNIVSQQITGLQPGRLYSLKLITADHQDLLAGESREPACAVTVRIEDADVQQGAFTYPFISARGPKPYTRRHPFYMHYHYAQFRATGETARLVISDWADEDEPGGPIGQETMFSFVEVQPVFE